MVLILPSIIFNAAELCLAVPVEQRIALDLYGLGQAGNDAGWPEEELFLKASCLAYVAVHSAYRDQLCAERASGRFNKVSKCF